MTTELTNQSERILEVLVSGNLSVLTPPERVDYYNRVCDSLGLNPLTKPFEFITLNGKLTLYATKACTDQLRQIHGVSISEPSVSRVDDLYSVAVTATDKTGRMDSDMGVVAIGNLKGENLANAMLKAVTKAKRRVTLSICGLGMLDELEIEDIPASAKRPPVEMPKAIEPPMEKVNRATGEIVTAWTNGDLQKALNEAALAIKDLAPVLGEEATKDNFAALIDNWLAAHPGSDLGDLIGAAIEHHTGQPSLV